MIKHLCSGYDEPQAIRPATHAHFRQTDGSSDEGPVVSGGGNLIGSSGQSLTVPTTSRQVVALHNLKGRCIWKIATLIFHFRERDLSDLIKKASLGKQSCGRHLRGNWLAYWDHEVGRGDPDSSRLDLKQILLQTFQSHASAVRCLRVLDNENSFLSGSKDKTVKVWSLRACGGGGGGEGVPATAPQWTYNLHKRSVQYVEFLSRSVESNSTSVPTPNE